VYRCRMCREFALFTALLLAVALLVACAERSTPTPELSFGPVSEALPPAPEVEWDLHVTGAVTEPVVISYQDLVARDLVRLADILEACDCGDEVRNTWEGIALGDLLAEAGASQQATAVILRGADGYWRKAPIGDVGLAMVALRRDGVWLAEDLEEGPIRMVVPGQSASYWMSQLVEIEVIE